MVHDVTHGFVLGWVSACLVAVVVLLAWKHGAAAEKAYTVSARNLVHRACSCR
jgi:hypothetical protein